jgi:hypothetical protein
VLAGGGGRTILLSTGPAAAITESISMGAVGYTSAVADRDYYTAQRTEEESALVDDADLKCQEIIELYRSGNSRRTARPGRGDHHGQSRALARHSRAAASISARAELNDL